jgi:putative membrane protein
VPPDALALVSTVVAWHHDGWVWVWGGLMIVIWVAITVVVVWLLETPAGRHERPPTDRAREVVAERYARGGISADEYHERLDVLRINTGGEDEVHDRP